MKHKRLFRYTAKMITVVAFMGWLTDDDYFIISAAPNQEATYLTPETKDDADMSLTPSASNPSGEKGATIGKDGFYRFTETPRMALKTNLLYDLTTTPNLAAEFRLGRKVTLDLSFNLNPWTYDKAENTKFKFFLFQPEFRFWACEAFNGHFFGLHGHYAYFNVSHLPNPPFSETMNQYRFEGQLAGAGVSYGFNWIINPRWGMEFEIGAGFVRLWYDRYPCADCAKAFESETKDYWGVTRIGLSFIYYIF